MGQTIPHSAPHPMQRLIASLAYLPFCLAPGAMFNLTHTQYILLDTINGYSSLSYFPWFLDMLLIVNPCLILCIFGEWMADGN